MSDVSIAFGSSRSELQLRRYIGFENWCKPDRPCELRVSHIRSPCGLSPQGDPGCFRLSQNSSQARLGPRMDQLNVGSLVLQMSMDIGVSAPVPAFQTTPHTVGPCDLPVSNSLRAALNRRFPTNPVARWRSIARRNAHPGEKFQTTRGE